jgi:hypothetical protein
MTDRVHVPSLPARTRLLIETSSAFQPQSDRTDVFEFNVLFPEHNIVRVTGTADIFKEAPVRCLFVESAQDNPVNGPVHPGYLVKGWRFVLRLACGLKMLSGHVRSTRIEGDGWYYEV